VYCYEEEKKSVINRESQKIMVYLNFAMLQCYSANVAVI